MIEAFSLVDVLCNTWIWATWKSVMFVNPASFSIICWQCSLFLDWMPETSSIHRAHVLTKHILLSFWAFRMFSDFILFSWRSSRFSANCFLWSLASWASFSFWSSNFLFVKSYVSSMFSTVHFPFIRGFLLLYCCPYLLIFGLEPEVWLGVLLSFLRLLCLRYLTWSVISFFFHSMHMLKSLSIWPSGIFFTFLLHLVLHICFYLVRHFNTVHNHFWFCKGWLLGYFWHSQKSCRSCTGKGELVNFIHNGSEITTWVECSFRSKSTKSKPTILR